MQERAVGSLLDEGCNVELLLYASLDDHSVGESVQLQQPNTGYYCGQVEKDAWTEPGLYDCIIMQQLALFFHDLDPDLESSINSIRARNKKNELNCQ